MAASKHASLVIFAVLSMAMLSAKPTGRGTTLPLIHRDSPNSPFHNPTHSRYDQIRSAISRSISQAKGISTRIVGSDHVLSDAKTEIISNRGDYLMNVSIGTPPFPILGIADTASDLTWTQCEPCSNCYDQNAPLFDTRKSSTYQPISCSAPQCTSKASGFDSSCDSSKKCHYSVVYGEASTSAGTIAAETLTLGSSKFPNTIFGCGFENRGQFSSSGSGIIGLGNGPTSLIGQLDKSIGGKFSYCLVPISSTSTKSSEINFGENAVVVGDGVVSTPLVTGTNVALYYSTLNAITIGEKRIPFTSSSGSGLAAGKGNIVIDSATLLLQLPQDFLNALIDEIRRQVKAVPVDDPSGQLSLCYNLDGFKSPKMVSNFDGGDIVLNDLNIWLPTSDNLLCFAATASSTGTYGNLIQTNFLVGYDKERKTVSFKPTDCTK